MNLLITKAAVCKLFYI